MGTGGDVGDYRKLEVWQMAHALTLEIYQASSHYPRHEMYGITAQLRRAAASIAANIAEGCGRNTDAELNRSVRIALGSAAEVDYFLLLSRDLRMLAEEDYQRMRVLAERIRSMLGAFHHALSTASARSSV